MLYIEEIQGSGSKSTGRPFREEEFELKIKLLH
jgi:hypothetical protein